MYKYLIGILLFCYVSSASINAQTHASGFYIILSERKDCTHPFKTLSLKKPLCLSKEPIVNEREFENVSAIIVDSVTYTKHINLKISEAAFKRLQILTLKIPKIALVLVIDETIIGVFDDINRIVNPIPIISNLYSNDINWIYKRLKTKN